jgi:hypothetical protein
LCIWTLSTWEVFNRFSLYFIWHSSSFHQRSSHVHIPSHCRNCSSWTSIFLPCLEFFSVPSEVFACVRESQRNFV